MPLKSFALTSDICDAEDTSCVCLEDAPLIRKQGLSTRHRSRGPARRSSVGEIAVVERTGLRRRLLTCNQSEVLTDNHRVAFKISILGYQTHSCSHVGVGVGEGLRRRHVDDGAVLIGDEVKESGDVLDDQ